jgi:hypothetical protein
MLFDACRWLNGCGAMRTVVISAYVRDAALLSLCLREIREEFPEPMRDLGLEEWVSKLVCPMAYISSSLRYRIHEQIP